MVKLPIFSRFTRQVPARVNAYDPRHQPELQRVAEIGRNISELPRIVRSYDGVMDVTVSTKSDWM